ncbi:MAG: hypothetical protein C5B54_09865 [Acidobacteria bacterium]|nr:MAG: hypothetical protein C5B54_09865 [Acidobacteriota bacterium]
MPKYVAAFLVCILCLTSLVFAQTSGGIRGVIADADGNPLPGALVTISSKVLIGKRTTTTNELGVFRFPSVPVGTYSAEATLEGFSTVKADSVEVKLGVTANVPLTMKITNVNEAMTIVGETPLIDPTKSQLSTNYSNEILKEIPTQRGMWDLMQVSPGISVDTGDSQSSGMIAFGSGRTSNSWNIDGVDVTGPETGGAWLFVNPDNIQEIEVLGVGAPAEYGNHTGAVLNVVTKSGGNDYHGAANFYYQSDALTGNNVTLPDSSYGFSRKKFNYATGQFGGPIRKDKLWFFGSIEYSRDGFAFAGNDPALTPIQKSDKYDAKVSGRVGEHNDFSAFYHNEIYRYPESTSPYSAQSALGNEIGNDPSWGGTFNSTISDKTLFEAAYSGWTSVDRWLSQANVQETPFTNYDVFPYTYSGGLLYPYDYRTSRHQFKAKLTHYADKFLGSQHEFRFGAQYGRGKAETIIAYGANGYWDYQSYGFQYRVVQAPYLYGGTGKELGIFLDDTVTLNHRTTLNLGVRFDHNTGSIPDFKRLGIGTPSISPIGNVIETGETIPGHENLIDWNVVSPRLGFTYQVQKDGRSEIQGSFGVYYDHNVYGNWDAPAPQLPAITTYRLNPKTGQYEITDQYLPEDFTQNPSIKAPRTLQYSVGYNQQLNKDSAFGAQYVYKDTKDLVGWEILGGTYNPVPFVDPFTGKTITLLSIVDQPLLQKGNDPGDFPGSEGLKYFQKYHGLVFTYNKRFSKNWSMNASYTWSKSYGLTPTPLDQTQSSPLYGSRTGSDPNNYINAVGRLQADRPHMFRVQGVFFHLPGDLQFSANAEFSSGRPYARQVRAGGDGLLNQDAIIYTSEPRGNLRFSPIEMVDLSVAREFKISGEWRLRLEGDIFNLLNSDQELFWTTQTLAPGEQFVPDTWVKPRRLQIRVALQF